MSNAPHKDNHGHDGEFNAGETIMHHILDGKDLSTPLFGTPYQKIDLPSGWYLGGQKTSAHTQAPSGLLGIDFSPTKHTVYLGVIAIIMLVVFISMARSKFGTRNRFFAMLEAFVQFIRDDIAIPNIGEEDGRKFTPFLLTVFFFIYFANMIGLIPGSITITGNISVTAALAFITFMAMQYGGVSRNGLIGHFKGLMPHGLPILIVPMIFVIELAGMFTKPFALCVRLFANMIAGHIVILALICLVFILKSIIVGFALTIPLSLFVYCLELLVCFLQAYIFTMLSAIFIGMTCHPEH